MDSVTSLPAKASPHSPRSKNKKRKFERLLLWTQPRGIGPGLRNVGNTCFINSSLQCLIYTPPIQNYRHACSQEFCTLSALQKLAEFPSGTATPDEIISRMKFFGRQFRRGQQEDAHEFLRCLMDKIHEKEFVRLTFGGVLRSIVRCLVCQHSSKTFDRFLDLSLELTSSDVYGCFQQFCSEETLSESERYYCTRCARLVPSTKQLYIKKAPLILTLHLKRFSNDGKKDNRVVTFPPDIEVSEVTPKETILVSYKLYAVLVHDGYASRSGHYFALVETPDSMWYELNDARTEPKSQEEVLRQGAAYILFYKKTKSSPEPLSFLVKSDGRSLKLNPTLNHTPNADPLDLSAEAQALFSKPFAE